MTLHTFQAKLWVLLVTVIALLGTLTLFSSEAQALPGSGECSNSSGAWICNVENQQIAFDRTSTVTQPTAASGSTETIGDSISSLGTYRYLNVYTDGTTSVDANVTITGFNGTPELDTNTVPDFGKEAISVNVASTEYLSFTVDFINASTGEPVTMLNIEILVVDLDGSTQLERAVFQGLSSYRLDNSTSIQVDPSTAPSPETGQRIFKGTVSNSNTNLLNPTAGVSTKFASVSSLRLKAYTDGSGGGIGFKFGPTTSFWSGTSSTETTVGFGNYIITYDANTGSGTVPSSTTTAGSFTLPVGTGLSSNGISISSWNTRADGSGQTLALGGTFLPSGNTTLYAQYVSQSVTFNANSGSGSMANQSSAGPATLTSNTFTKTGYRFAGWNTQANGSGASFADSASYPFSISTTLYAQWAANTYLVTFNEAGGSAVADTSYVYGSSFTYPSNPTKAGYAFGGWFAAASGGSALTEAQVSAGASDVTLYAQWTLLPNQTVTWSPSNTNIPQASGSVTPSTTATSNGGGTITYSVTSAGSTGCSVDSTTGTITHAAIGVCTVRATAAANQNFGAGYTESTFSFSSTSPAISLALDLSTGSTVANSDVNYAVSGLKTNSDWTLTVRSTPQVIASGTFANGLVNGLTTMPAGLEAGWHSITLVGTAPDGQLLSQTIWFEVSENGTFLQSSQIAPPTGQLASTGYSGGTVLFALFMLMLGIGVVIINKTLRRSEA